MSLRMMNLIVLVWFIVSTAAVVAWHRLKSGQWLPYTEEEVEDPDWNDKH